MLQAVGRQSTLVKNVRRLSSQQNAKKIGNVISARLVKGTDDNIAYQLDIPQEFGDTVQVKGNETSLLDTPTSREGLKKDESLKSHSNVTPSNKSKTKAKVKHTLLGQGNEPPSTDVKPRKRSASSPAAKTKVQVTYKSNRDFVISQFQQLQIAQRLEGITHDPVNDNPKTTADEPGEDLTVPRSISKTPAEKSKSPTVIGPVRFVDEDKPSPAATSATHPTTDNIEVIKSSSDETITYVLNKSKRTCTCPGFTNRGRCKHVDGLSKNRPL